MACRALVVDDEAIIRSLLTMFLSSNGFIVETAENGEKAIQKIKRNNYGLVITDMKMPGIGGEQVLDYLRNTFGSRVPVIGISGTPWLMEGLDFDGVLFKPISMASVMPVIQKSLS